MATKPLFTSIQAGQYKGKKILLPSLDSTRSTKAIVKGSFFDTFQNELREHFFVEVFGGSGSVGLEALSRGAEHAYFIEKDKRAYAILTQNTHSINPTKTTALYGDSFILLSSLFPRLTCKTFFYIDPPFSIREGMQSVYEQTLCLIASIPHDIAYVIAVEHMSALQMPSFIGTYALLKTRRFGKTSLSYYM